jgi:fatty-acyl-CoA synthase
MEFVSRDWAAFHAERRPHDVGLIRSEDGERLTWREIDRRVGKLARHLRDAGVRRGDRVAVLAENDPRTFLVQFALVRIGAAMVPLNWRLTPPELEAILTDARPHSLIADERWQDVAAALSARTGVPLALRWTDGADSEFDAAVEAADYLPAAEENVLGDTMLLLYTSGTTGLPKGVVSTHATVIWQAVNNVTLAGVARADAHFLVVLPLCTAGALNTLANPVLYFGGTVTTMRRFDPDTVLAALLSVERPVRQFAAPPTLYRRLADAAGFADARFDGDRYFIVGAGSVTPEAIDLWDRHGVRLRNQYGSTETGPTALMIDPVADWAKARLGSCGTPVLHMQVRLVSEDGVDVPDDVDGEIWVRGPSVTTGYWSPAYGSAFTEDGWYRTGDVARRDGDGYHYISGRVVDMYKTGGQKVYPVEVERVLLSHPAVQDVAVTSIPDREWGETGAALELDELRDFASARLARYKLPTRLLRVPEIPRNVLGKVSRPQLAALFSAPTR